jgi:hypothetical protein
MPIEPVENLPNDREPIRREMTAVEQRMPLLVGGQSEQLEERLL